MKLSTLLPLAGADPAVAAAHVADLERAGLDLVWVAEPYGFDAPTMLGYLAAVTSTVQLGAGILPIYSRTPALTAMTAAGLDRLSGGRAVLGLGAPAPLHRPLARGHPDGVVEPDHLTVQQMANTV